MDPGRRDKFVTLQSYATSQDAYGQEVQTWADLGTEWAAVFYGTGDERRQAAKLEGGQSATFQVLSNPVTRAVGLKDRIVFGADNWNIVSIAPLDRATIEFTAIRSL